MRRRHPWLREVPSDGRWLPLYREAETPKDEEIIKESIRRHTGQDPDTAQVRRYAVTEQGIRWVFRRYSRLVGQEGETRAIRAYRAGATLGLMIRFVPPGDVSAPSDD